MNDTIKQRQKREKDELIKQFEKIPIIQTACAKVGIGRATYYRWRKDDEKFAEMADEALREGVQLMNDLAESQLLSAIRDKNMTAIIYWLKNRHRAYSAKLELTGSIKTNDGTLTPEQQKLLDKATKLVFEGDQKDAI